MSRNPVVIDLSEKDIERFWSKVDKKSEDECWLWLGSVSEKNYGHFWLKYTNAKAHRVSWVIHYGSIAEESSYHGMCVCHTCDNPGCVNPAHLFLGTHTDNMQDKAGKGRAPGLIGENNRSHKLTEQQVIEILEKFVPQKYTLKRLAEEYNVALGTIHDIIYKRRWRHVKK